MGIKLWSDNLYYLNEIIRLQRMQTFDYIELYSLPGTFDKHIDFWTNLKSHYIIHASHFGHGVNLGQKEAEDINRKLINEARAFADRLNADIVIVHPGINGTKEETIRQLNGFNDQRLIIENKPYYGYTKDQICVGSAPSDINAIMQETGLRFCFDVGHSIYAANGLGINPFQIICDFTKMNPVVVHLTDGDWAALHDVHKHYGEGNFPLSDILDLLPSEKLFTNEAGKKSKENLNDFESDVAYLKNIINRKIENNYITVRRATMDDAQNMYNLSMDPTVRAVSLSSNSFSYESHIEWLNISLFDKSKLFFVCEMQNEFIGQIRFSVFETSAIISISIIAQWRGMGVTPLLFNRAVKEVKMIAPEVKTIVAIVKKDNVSSNKFFKKLGFIHETGDDSNLEGNELKYIFKIR